MRLPKTNTLLCGLLIGTASLALCSCGGDLPQDAHAAPRETKTYETVIPGELDPQAQIAHLNLILTEIAAATTAEATAEFHHLEVALTAALDAIEKQATESQNTAALATISKIKPLAIKMHEAGHDDNTAMGSKLAPAIEKLCRQLVTEL